MKRLGSGIIGRVEAEMRENSVGPKPGTTDVSISAAESANKARAWLLEQVSPRAADEALRRSLISMFNVTASLLSETLYPPEGGYRTEVTGCRYFVGVNGDWRSAREQIELSMTPPTVAQAEGFLVVLQAACARRADSEANAGVMLSLYAETLCGYPVDVAKAACLQLARGKGPDTNWFPTLGEVVYVCDKLSQERRAMVGNLTNRTYASDAPAPETLESLPAILPVPEPPEGREAYVKRMMAEYYEMCPKPILKPLPPAHGAVGPGGITPEMRALLTRKAAMTA